MTAMRMAALLAAPPARTGRTWLTGARLFDGTGAALRADAAMLVEDGVIVRVGGAAEPAPAGADVLELEGRTVLPGLVDAHAHVYTEDPVPAEGAEPLWPGVAAHLTAARLRAVLRMGVLSVRDVGSFGDDVVALRQAMRHGAFRGPRLLTCGRIVSATGPGGRSFSGMYREADGPDEVRKAVREQVRRGADLVKVMSTGARSVELEDPNPAQITRAEMDVLVEEAHRLGLRVAAHAEGLAGTELAIRAGVDTVEHGMYLSQRPDLLDAMAAAGQVLVPTLSCYYGVAGAGSWTAPLAELAEHNLAQAEATLKAARVAGVPIALGHDWHPFGDVATELLRMIDHGLTAAEALRCATAVGAAALGIDHVVGTVEAGKLADLVVVDGDPVAEPALLQDRSRIWLVVQRGDPVAGAALEQAPPARLSRHHPGEPAQPAPVPRSSCGRSPRPARSPAAQPPPTARA